MMNNLCLYGTYKNVNVNFHVPHLSGFHYTKGHVIDVESRFELD